MNTQHFMARAAAAVAAVALALGTGGALASSAMADDTVTAPAAGDITISVPPADGNGVAPVIDGRTFTAYKLANYDTSTAKVSGDNVTSYNLTPATGITDTELRNWIKSAVTDSEGNVTGTAGDGTSLSDLIKVEDGTVTFTGAAENLTPLQFVAKYFYGTGTDAYDNEHADNAQMRSFAHAAQASLKDATGVTSFTATAGTNATSVSIDTKGDQGLYLIVETTPVEPEGEMVSRAMVIGTPMSVDGTTYYNVVGNDTKTTYALGEVNLKAEHVEVTKDVKGDDQLIQVGSTRQFAITANVPDYATEFPDATNLKFEIGDTASSNLNPFDGADVNGLAVTAGDTALTAGTDYTVATDTDANGFTVKLTDPAAQSGKTITVTYTAKVTNLDADATTNSAKVDFTNNPYDHEDHTTKTTTKNLYDTRLTLDKVKFGGEDTHLNGAKFTVTGPDGAVKFDKINDQTYSVNPNGSTPIVIANVGDKPVTIKGLGADSSKAVTYTFTETTAPAGYILGDHPVEFTMTITPSFEQNKVTGTNDLTSVSYTMDSTNHKNFIDLSDITSNSAVKDMPATDGTHIDGGTMRVENTTSASDFARTGGDVVRVLGIAVALAAIGAACLIVARTRRNRA